jgi:hypothetical protein
MEARLHAAEHRLIEELHLRPRALPPDLAAATGRWKDAPVSIATRAYEGDAIEYMRVALVSGIQLSVGNLLAVPRPNRPVPILGANLVWHGGRRETMVATDLSPVRDALERDAELAAIARIVPDTSALPSGGELPRWCVDWCSSSVLYTRVGPAQAEVALKAFDGYVAGFIVHLAGAPPSPEHASHVRAMHEGYAMARRADDGERGMLAAMFGKVWAEEYVRRVLFP